MTGRGGLAGLRVALVGPGAVGSALARDLSAAGAEVRLWSRTPGRAAAVRRRLAGGAPGHPRPSAKHLLAPKGLPEALQGADALVLAVGDDALEPASLEAAAALAPKARPVALHTCGARGPAALGALARAGASVGVLHPLAPLPARAAPSLSGAWFAVAGEPRAVRLARRLVRGVGGRVLALHDDPASQLAYHAAASLASGGLVALFDVALAPCAGAARDAAAARAALLELMARTLENLRQRPAGDALTGPAARGSEELVAEHVAALAAAGAEDAAELYRVLARRMVALARRRGTLSAGEARRVLARLDSAT